MSQSGTDHVYIVTDIEADGPWLGPNSMRSFASVAVTHGGGSSLIFEALRSGGRKVTAAAF